MSETDCALAADAKVETPEGPMAIRAVAGKAIAVFTRDPNGRVRFRMMQNVRKILEQQPVLKLTFENGRTVRVGPTQVLFKNGMVACRAAALSVGDDLECAFHFPAGYEFTDDRTHTRRVSSRCLRLTAIEPGGTADLYALSVHQSQCFMVTAGVLCKAEEAAAP